MGLFSKKPKSSPTDETPVGISSSSPTSSSGSSPSSGGKPPKPPKKGSIDPNEFNALRAELIDVRARLDASEQAKAIVESRLAALDATTTAMATDRVGMGSDDLHARIAQLEAQLNDVNERAAQVANAEPPSLPDPVPHGPDPLLVARIDELAARIDQVGTQAAGDTELARRVDELSARVGVADPELTHRLDELAGRVALAPDFTGRIDELEARVAAAADPANRVEAAPVPDADTLRRLDELDQRLGAIDTLSAQISQLSARVAGQAEFGAQLSALRDRITEIQTATDERQHSMAAAAVAATADAELRDRVNALADRLAATEALSGQMGQLAERLTANDASSRQTAEQVSLLDQRVQAVATELTNQISELGRDIDGLAAHQNEAPTSSVSDEVIEALRTSQVRLANEQARYEIAFRQDLANLAEHLRQPRR